MFLPSLAVFFLLLLSSNRLDGRPIKISSSLREYDQFLKSVNDNEPEDEFDDVDNNAQNSWELSGKFEGDIILSDQQQKVLLQEEAQPGLARNGLKDVSKRWPGNTLVYDIHDSHFTSEQKQGIRDAMDDLERSSCVKFKERDSSDSDYVMIQGKRRGCFSRVGYQGGGAQVLNLTPHPVGLGCMSHGTITHELLHALGFFHMQSHTKRDDYVKIHWDNILEGRENNFKKYNSFVSSDYGVPYDYDSVLHYSAHAFSKNGRKTIVPKSSDFVQIGQRLGPSDKDILKLNRMYKCDGGSSGRTGAGSFGGFSSKGGIEPFDSDIQFNDEGLYTPKNATTLNTHRPSQGYDVYESDEYSHESADEENKTVDDEPIFSSFWSNSRQDDSFPKNSYEFSGWWER